MQFAFLGSSASWYLGDLRRAAAGRHEIIAVEFEQLRSRVTSEPCRVLTGEWDLHQFDAVLVRSMPPGSLEQVVFRMDALAQLQLAGVPVINPPRSLEIAIDKYLALAKLKSIGLTVPDTICCQTSDAAIDAFHELGGEVVVKPIFGGEGRGVMRVSDAALAIRTFRTLEQLRAVIYVQRYIPNDGFDLRLSVVGDEVFGMRRIANEDWRTNISQGARAEAHRVTNAQRDIALDVSRTIGAPLCGLDLLPSVTGTTYALEVNAVPGWKALSRVLSVDIAAKVLDFMELVADGSQTS